MLQETYLTLLQTYTHDSRLINDLWAEIVQHYSDKKRHYHTLSHLALLLNELMEVKSEIRLWDAVLFSLYYHDFVYDVSQPDNEEASAEVAQTALKRLQVPDATIAVCRRQIEATKGHLTAIDSDTNYFLDADLCILGQYEERYQAYAQQVRQEYSIYPDPVYNNGRKNVLQHFLEMERIFKTDHFYNKYESAAKRNLLNELSTL